MSPKATDNLALQKIAPLIQEIRGERVILDSDLARIYGVTTKRLNEQVKRNKERFPDDFAFQVTQEEAVALRSQIATLNTLSMNRSQIVTSSSRSQSVTGKRGQHRKYLPYAFTEHGAIMAANVLNSRASPPGDMNGKYCALKGAPRKETSIRKGKTKTVARSAKTRKFVTKKYASTHKSMTEVERVKASKKK